MFGKRSDELSASCVRKGSVGGVRGDSCSLVWEVVSVLELEPGAPYMLSPLTTELIPSPFLSLSFYFLRIYFIFLILYICMGSCT